MHNLELIDKTKIIFLDDGSDFDDELGKYSPLSPSDLKLLGDPGPALLQPFSSSSLVGLPPLLRSFKRI